MNGNAAQLRKRQQCKTHTQQKSFGNQAPPTFRLGAIFKFFLEIFGFPIFSEF